jgi:hypothetical protein
VGILIFLSLTEIKSQNPRPVSPNIGRDKDGAPRQEFFAELCSAARECPVIKHEILNASELVGVVCNQGHAETAGTGGNE